MFFYRFGLQRAQNLNLCADFHYFILILHSHSFEGLVVTWEGCVLVILNNIIL
jgi:hypothetical protein